MNKCINMQFATDNIYLMGKEMTMHKFTINFLFKRVLTKRLTHVSLRYEKRGKERKEGKWRETEERTGNEGKGDKRTR